MEYDFTIDISPCLTVYCLSDLEKVCAIRQTPGDIERERLMDMGELPLKDMDQRHRGLTPSVANSFVEAARVCLDRHHTPPVVFDIQDDSEASQATVDWSITDARTRDAWANKTDATEAGAYACAIAAIELTRSLFALRRAETLTGADYYVGSPDHDPNDLEGCLRLEVSGTSSLDRGYVSSRLNQKLKQLTNGRSNLPGLAAVVGFGARIIMLAILELQ